MSAFKIRENRLRRKAERLGWTLSKSRRRDPTALEFGLYALLARDQRRAGHPIDVHYSSYCLSLDDVERLLEDEEIPDSRSGPWRGKPVVMVETELRKVEDW